MPEAPPTRPRDRHRPPPARPPPPGAHGAARTARRLPALALALSVALVLAATLHPSAYEGAQGWDGCVLCGSRGLADALLNVGLFVPLGASLAWVGVGWGRGIVLAALLSAGVELAQLAVPGRDPSPPDLLFNALGTVAGLALARAAPGLLRPGPARAGWLALGWSALFAASVAAGAWLTAPSPGGAPVFAQFNAEVGGRPPYAGRLLSASLGAVPLRPGPSDRPAAVRGALRRGEPLRLRFAAAPAPPGAPATLLRLAGDGDAGLALVAIDGDDVLFAYRMRAAGVRLDAPLHRLPGVLRGVAPGEVVELAIEREGRRVRARALGGGARSGASEPGAGRGWALLWFAVELSPRALRWLDAVWLALWAAPLGFWMRRTGLAVAAALLWAGSLALLAPLVGLGAAGAAAWGGAAAGFAAGRAGRMAASRG